MNPTVSSQLLYQLWQYGITELSAINQALQQQMAERQQVEAALQASEGRFRSFFDSASMMMGIVELVGDEDIRHLMDNATALKFFGLSAEKMQHCLSSSLGIPQSYIQRWIYHYRRAAETEAPVQFEYLHQTLEGERWLSATVCLIANKSGDGPRFAYIVEDVTDRKQAEVQIHQLNTELEERVQERTAQLEAVNQQLTREILERERALQELQKTEAAL